MKAKLKSGKAEKSKSAEVEELKSSGVEELKSLGGRASPRAATSQPSTLNPRSARRRQGMKRYTHSVRFTNSANDAPKRGGLYTHPVRFTNRENGASNGGSA